MCMSELRKKFASLKCMKLTHWCKKFADSIELEGTFNSQIHLTENYKESLFNKE